MGRLASHTEYDLPNRRRLDLCQKTTTCMNAFLLLEAPTQSIPLSPVRISVIPLSPSSCQRPLRTFSVFIAGHESLPATNHWPQSGKILQIVTEFVLMPTNSSENRNYFPLSSIIPSTSMKSAQLTLRTSISNGLVVRPFGKLCCDSRRSE